MSIFLYSLSGLIHIYSFIILFRIIITWFSGSEIHTGAFSFLIKITDPYLNIFRRIRFLRRGSIDFSIIFAILVLNIVGFILGYLSIAQTITIWTIIGAIALSIYRTFFFLLLFFGVLVIIMIVIITIVKKTHSQIYFTLSSILEPITAFIRKCIPGGRKLEFVPVLIVTFIFISILCLFGLFIIEPSLEHLLTRAW